MRILLCCLILAAGCSQVPSETIQPSFDIDCSTSKTPGSIKKIGNPDLMGGTALTPNCCGNPCQSGGAGGTF